MIATISKNVKTILSAIRNKAHYGGQIVIVNYYSLNYSSPAWTDQSQLVTPPSTSAVKPFHVEIADDGFGEFAAADVHSGGNTLHGRVADAAVDRRLWNPPELRRAEPAGPGAREGDPHQLSPS